MGKADTITYKHLAHFSSEKWSSPYSVVMGRLRCSLGYFLAALFILGDRVLDPSVPVCLQPLTLLLLKGTCLL